MTGEEELQHNDQFKVKALIRYRKTMDKIPGIRTPEQIIEDIANNVNKSREAKSRYLQNIVKDKITKLFSSIQVISELATQREWRRILHLKEPSHIQQNAKILNNTLDYTNILNRPIDHNHREPLLVVKKNREPALAIITLDHFFELLEKDD